MKADGHALASGRVPIAAGRGFEAGERDAPAW